MLLLVVFEFSCKVSHTHTHTTVSLTLGGDDLLWLPEGSVTATPLYIKQDHCLLIALRSGDAYSFCSQARLFIFLFHVPVQSGVKGL